MTCYIIFNIKKFHASPWVVTGFGVPVAFPYQIPAPSNCTARDRKPTGKQENPEMKGKDVITRTQQGRRWHLARGHSPHLSVKHYGEESVAKSRTGGQFRKECHKSLEERKPSVRVCSEGQGKMIVVVVLAVTRSFPQLPFPLFLLLTIFTFSLSNTLITVSTKTSSILLC